MDTRGALAKMDWKGSRVNKAKIFIILNITIPVAVNVKWVTQTGYQFSIKDEIYLRKSANREKIADPDFNSIYLFTLG